MDDLTNIHGEKIFSNFGDGNVQLYSTHRQSATKPGKGIQQDGFFLKEASIFGLRELREVDNESIDAVAQCADTNLGVHDQDIQLAVLQRAWLVNFILSTPSDCVIFNDVKQARRGYISTSIISEKKAKAILELKAMRKHPGHSNILQVHGLRLAKNIECSLLLAPWEYTLAIHLVTPGSDLRLSVTNKFNCEAWLKMLQDSYFGLDYVQYVGGMQLVAVSPEHLVWINGHWKWSEFSQAKTRRKIECDLFHFSQQLFMALPWEYTRHTMPELLQTLRVDGTNKESNTLFELLRALWEMAHSKDGDPYAVGRAHEYIKIMETRHDPQEDVQATSAGGSKTKSTASGHLSEELYTARNQILNNWKQTLDELRVKCKFKEPAPKEGMMLLAGFAKPTYAD